MAAMAASAIMKNSKALKFDVRPHGDPAKPCVIFHRGHGCFYEHDDAHRPGPGRS